MNSLLRLFQGGIARGTIRTSFVLGMRLVGQAGTLLIVARVLGPQQFGVFAGVAALAVMLGALASFGTNVLVLSEVSKDPARRRNVLPYAIPLTLGCGTILLAVYVTIINVAFQSAGVAFEVLILIGSAEMLLQPLLAVVSAEHLGLGRVARSQLLVILPLMLRLVAALLIFIVACADPLGAYSYAYFSASLFAFAFAMVTLPERWPTLQKWRVPRLNELGAAASYALINITATSPSELDKTLAIKALSLEASGLYSAGARILGAGMLPISAMMLSALPQLFRAERGPLKQAQRMTRWVISAALVYSFAFALLIWILAPAFTWVFGAGYQGIDIVIRSLALAAPGMAVRMAAGGVVMTLGKPMMRAGFEVSGLLLLIVATATLVPRYGVVGMALALACSEWGMAILGMSTAFYVLRKSRMFGHDA